jgi:hypothetical protein
MQFLIKKGIKQNFSAVIKALDPDPDSLERLDPDPWPDPQLSLYICKALLLR